MQNPETGNLHIKLSTAFKSGYIRNYLLPKEENKQLDSSSPH